MPDVLAERQIDWHQHVKQCAEYLQFVKKTAVEFGVEPQQLTELAAEAPPEAEQIDKPSESVTV